jgi:sulfate transport system ATP-binding protein
LVRPHDLELSEHPRPGSVLAEVTRVQRIGHEVRAELHTPRGDSWAQLTRGQADALALASGSRVWVQAAS